MIKFIFSLSLTLASYLVLRDILNAPARQDFKSEHLVFWHRRGKVGLILDFALDDFAGYLIVRDCFLDAWHLSSF